jgi:acetyltransferase
MEQDTSERNTNRPDILFSFRSVVVVGASEDQTRIGGTPIVLLRKYGFEGPIYGINPKYNRVQDCLCFASPEHLPEEVDVAIFAVSAAMVKQTLPGLRDKGLKGAVILSAGFGEAGEDGRELQRWISGFAARHRIAMLGPNCVGQISFARGRSLTFANAVLANPRMPTGRIALLSQSGGVATNLWADAALTGVGFSHMITTGNEADLGVAEYLAYLAEDPATEGVLGYIEGLKDGAAFCQAAAMMRERRKPLVLMKVGTSADGQDAMASHTGKLSSEDAGYQAAFDRHGVIRVSTLEALNDAARVFSLREIQPKVTVATTSGGAGVYVADLCAELGIGFSRLSASTEQRLAEFVPSYGRVRNPVDLTAQVVNDMSILASSLRILLDDPDTGILLFLLSGKGTEAQSEAAIRLFTKVQAETTKTLVICWLGVAETVRRRAAQAGLLVYQDPVRFLRPLRDRLHHALSREHENEAAANAALEHSDPARAPLDIARRLVTLADGSRILPERAALDLLETLGVDCPRRWFVRSEDEARALARTVSFPCVMKLVDPVVAHKSDVGAVALGLSDEAALLAAWRDMAARLRAREVMVAEQLQGGAEVLVGCVRDPTFGMRIALASGGVWANALRDSVTLVPPFTKPYVRSCLPRLAIWARLAGERGQGAMAVDQLVEAIAGIADFAWTGRELLREFECNPVIVTRHRAVAVDALGLG